MQTMVVKRKALRVFGQEIKQRLSSKKLSGFLGQEIKQWMSSRKLSWHIFIFSTRNIVFFPQMQEILKVIRITKAKNVCEGDLLVKGTTKLL